MPELNIVEKVIALEGVTVRAGAFSLEGVSFEVAAGAYAVLMGKTGMGKTTLLEAICGLRPLDAGRIRVGGRDVTDLRPGDRGISYVPQDRALFSAMTVRTRFAELMLPLLLLPFMLPPVTWAVQATVRLLSGRPASEIVGWIRLLAFYDLVFVTVCLLVFPPLMDE